LSTVSKPESFTHTTGVNAPGRAKISAKTLRTDRWWALPAVTALVFASFVIYSTWRAFSNANYYWEPYLSPFYSPCLSTSCTAAGAPSDLGTPFGSWFALGSFAISPALIILVFPLGFRLTCYYYRKAGYRSIWASPTACGVAEPHKKYTGESRAPLVWMNIHRFFFYCVLFFNCVLTWDAIVAFKDHEGHWGHMGLGTVFLVASATLLWIYSLSCHSCRAAVGGRLKHFSKHPVRYKLWTWVSRINPKHPMFAWLSLFAVAFADLYVLLVASGTITDPRFF